MKDNRSNSISKEKVFNSVFYVENKEEEGKTHQIIKRS